MERARLLGRYHAAVDYLDREIVRLAPRRQSRDGKVRTALEFNRRLGDPQRAYPSIQVAGTSGKGTVAFFIANALSAAGLRAGLHVSPYLQAFTEKTWIDGRYCSVGSLTAAVDAVRPAAEAFLDDDCPASVHGMASLAVSYLAFRRRALDIAVVETGLGGRFDLVQGLRRELSVVTELGLDHTQSLGPTLEEIAWHKAGIIEAGVPCVAVRGPGWQVLEREARAVGAPLVPISFEDMVEPQDGTLVLHLSHLGEVAVSLATAAPFVARNAVVAATALDQLARAGWPIRPEHVAAGLGSRFPGRFEVVQSRPTVVLDCAHNPQKVDALCKALGDGRLTVVFAATGARAPIDLLRALASKTSRLFATELELYGKAVVPAAAIARAGLELSLEAAAVPKPEDALDAALESCPAGGTVLVTGSVYLIGRLRDRWYPTDDVILERTSWPARRQSTEVGHTIGAAR